MRAAEVVVSLKVLYPTALGLVAGLVVLIVGAATGDATLKTVGVSIVVSALGYGGVGYAVPHDPKRKRRAVR